MLYIMGGCWHRDGPGRLCYEREVTRWKDSQSTEPRFDPYLLPFRSLCNIIPSRYPWSLSCINEYVVDSHETASNKFLLSAPFNIFFIMMHMKCTCAY